MRKRTCTCTLMLALLLTVLNACKKNTVPPTPPTADPTLVKDIDGNVYHTVVIGVQTWMVENLKVTHYSNGDAIPYSSTDLTNGSYCNYNNSTTVAAVYGRLYNLSAISDSRDICPAGFHLPSANDWEQLDLTLDGENGSGGAMKEFGTAHWEAPNTGATNYSGLKALPAGLASGGQFSELGQYAFFWADPSSSESRGLYYQSAASVVLVMSDYSTDFLSVRCVKNP